MDSYRNDAPHTSHRAAIVQSVIIVKHEDKENETESKQTNDQNKNNATKRYQ